MERIDVQKKRTGTEIETSSRGAVNAIMHVQSPQTASHTRFCHLRLTSASRPALTGLPIPLLRRTNIAARWSFYPMNRGILGGYRDLFLREPGFYVLGIPGGPCTSSRAPLIMRYAHLKQRMRLERLTGLVKPPALRSRRQHVFLKNI